MISALRGNLLDKGVRKLVACLSKLSGATGGAVVKKPKRLRMEILACLAELENGTGESFFETSKTGILYVTSLKWPTSAKSHMAKQNIEYATNKESSYITIKQS